MGSAKISNHSIRLMNDRERTFFRSITSFDCCRNGCPLTPTHEAKHTITLPAEGHAPERDYAVREHLCEAHAREYAEMHDLSFYSPLDSDGGDAA